MLNVLRSSRSPRHIRLEGVIAIGLGMVMSLLWMALQEQGASEKISALKIQKTAWQQQLLARPLLVLILILIANI